MIMVPLSLCIAVSMKRIKNSLSEIEPLLVHPPIHTSTNSVNSYTHHHQPTPVQTATCITRFTAIQLLCCSNQTNLVELQYEYPELDFIPPCIRRKSNILVMDLAPLTANE